MRKAKLDIEKMIRPNCRSFEPYIAGKPVETIRRELGLKKVVKLASNENPLGPSTKAVTAVTKAMASLYFYPDSNSWGLRAAVADKFAVKPENVLLGAGSDEIIELIAKLFFSEQDEIVVSAHAFIRYQMAGTLMNASVVTVPMKEYTHDLDAMAAAVGPRTKALFVTNPNNPTGTYNTKQEMARFLAAVVKKRPVNTPLVIIDEAYYEYASGEENYPEVLGWLPRFPNLVILRTFSKAYGLAGLRVGYGFAASSVVDFIDRIRPPFNINSLAQVAAVASLTDAAQVKKSVALVRAEKKYLYGELTRMEVPYVPSAANFILLDVAPWKGRDVFQRLLREGVIARAMDEYEYPTHLRVSIGLPEENRLFIRGLKKILASDCSA